MNRDLKHWLSMALCCVPMLAAPLLFVLAGAMGWRIGVFGVIVTALAVLACPLGMGLMMWQMARHTHAEAAPTMPRAHSEPQTMAAVPEPSQPEAVQSP